MMSDCVHSNDARSNHDNNYQTNETVFPLIVWVFLWMWKQMCYCPVIPNGSFIKSCISAV